MTFTWLIVKCDENDFNKVLKAFTKRKNSEKIVGKMPLKWKEKNAILVGNLED